MFLWITHSYMNHNRLIKNEKKNIRNKKRVRFNNNVMVGYTYAKEEYDRSLINLLANNVFNICNNAESHISFIINEISVHKILFFNNDESNIEIKNKNIEWYNDYSPINIINFINSSIENRDFFMKVFNFFVNSQLKIHEIGNIEYTMYGVNIKIFNIKRMKDRIVSKPIKIIK